MGHGDEIIRADGLDVTTLLDGILPLFDLDSYADPLVMMQPVEGDQLDPAVENQYLATVRRHAPSAKTPLRIDRFAFYARARSAFTVVMTGEIRKYGNLLLKKGVTPPAKAGLQ